MSEATKEPVELHEWEVISGTASDGKPMRWCSLCGTLDAPLMSPSSEPERVEDGWFSEYHWLCVGGDVVCL